MHFYWGSVWIVTSFINISEQFSRILKQKESLLSFEQLLKIFLIDVQRLAYDGDQQSTRKRLATEPCG